MKSFLKSRFSARRLTIVAACAAFFAAGQTGYAITSNWNADAADVWSNAARWSAGIPDAAEDIANLNFNLGTNRIITINGAVASRTLGVLTIGDSNNSHSYTLAASGGGTLTFDNGLSNASLTQLSTSFGDTISAPIRLNSSLDLTNSAAARTLTLSGAWSTTTAGTKTVTIAGSAAGTITMSGVISESTGQIAIVKNNTANTLTLSGANTFSGGVTHGGGTLNINNSGTGGTSSALGTGTFTIAGGTINNTSAGAVTLSTNNAQNWNGNFTFGGAQDLNLGTGAVTMSASRTITLGSSNNTLTVGGNISGATFGLTTVNSGSAITTVLSLG